MNLAPKTPAFFPVLHMIKKREKGKEREPYA